MFKVSFKGTKKSPCKKVRRFGDRETVVTLIGMTKMPDIHIPMKIWEKVSRLSSVDVIPDLVNNGLIIEVEGRAMRNDRDEDNPRLGERLAEARAKARLYEFMKFFTQEIISYYCGMFYGTKGCITVQMSDISPDSLQYANWKYERLLKREFEHIGNLLKEA